MFGGLDASLYAVLRALWRLEQFRLEAADAKTDQRRFHAIDNLVRSPIRLSRSRLGRLASSSSSVGSRPFAMTRLTTQPS